jgi:esterase
MMERTMQLHVERIGHGPPLVLMHGLFGAGRNWRAIARHLQTHWTCYLVDLPNHGASPHTPEMSIAQMAVDVETWMTAASLTNAVVLGHSMGGKVAMQMAMTNATRIAQLIVVDVAPRVYPGGLESIIAALQGLDVLAIASRNEAVTALAPAIPNASVRRFLCQSLIPQDGGPWRWGFNLQSIATHYRQLLGATPPESQYDGPTLFIRGAESNYVLDSDAAQIHTHFPQAQIETIANAGHWVHSDAPDAFIALISKFLSA